MSERQEFVALARVAGSNKSELSRRFGISRKTGYKWLRLAGEGDLDPSDRSRRPVSSPWRTPEGVEAQVLALRERYPFYGGRKIRHLLMRAGVEKPPAASTITAILDRHGLLSAARRRVRDWRRFEHEAPNSLWQMDFKGHFATERGRCHPLTMVDDHSRFCICLAACRDEMGTTVSRHLREAFERYGLPERILTDNGSPWGAPLGQYTRFSAGLIRLGVSVWHGRPLHPQTQGKEERFHRTLKLEVIGRRPVWGGLSEVQAAFDGWRTHYNLERPHESLGYASPVSRYAPSGRAYPRVLPPIEYEEDWPVRKVMDNGRVKFKGKSYFVGKAFIGEPVGLRQVGEAVWDVYYCHQPIIQVDLSLPVEVHDV